MKGVPKDCELIGNLAAAGFLNCGGANLGFSKSKGCHMSGYPTRQLGTRIRSTRDWQGITEFIVGLLMKFTGSLKPKI